MSHRCPIAGSSPLDFSDDRRPDKISAGEVSSCVVPAGRDMLTQPPLTGVSAIVSAYMLRRGAANPRFWSPYSLGRCGHFSLADLGCNISLGNRRRSLLRPASGEREFHTLATNLFLICISHHCWACKTISQIHAHGQPNSSPQA